MFLVLVLLLHHCLAMLCYMGGDVAQWVHVRVYV